MLIAKFFRSILAVTTLLLALSVCAVAVVEACPFCASVGLTFTDQMASKDVVVAAKLIEIPEVDPDAVELPQAKFEITKVFRGQKLVAPGMKFRALLVGKYELGQKFFVMGVNPPNINWTTPMKASDRLLEYFARLDTLPEKGADRLAFFQDYFEDEESVLAFDAYDEFAKAPYEDLIDLKDRMDRPKLLRLINDDNTSPNRRRLYFTMLGVCGQPEDTRMLEELMLSGSRKQMRGLEALIACYLTLKGEDGMELVSKTFFEDEDCEFTNTMLAMQALRFHASETDVVPRERIIAAARHVLDRDEARDMVIPDLARWEDWSVMEKLVKIFRESDGDDNWIRVPIASYLFACPLPKAKVYLAELKEMDPASIARARYLDGGIFDDDSDEDEEESSEDDASDGDSQQDSAESDEGSGDASLGVEEVEYISVAGAIERHVVRRVDIGNDPAAESVVGNAEFDSRAKEYQASNISGDVANPISETYVSNKSIGQVARSAPASPPPAITPVAAARPDLTLKIIFVPMVVSIGLFVLLWSVLSGWFERLIF
jgi:hypothetical protein